MKREWKPGDVAMVECSDREWRPALYAPKTVFGWANWRFADGLLRDAGLSIARPLVVIDPEDAATLDALGKAWDEAEACDLDNEQPMTMRALRMRIALREFANPTPPKPEEPTGLGAVVEDAEGRKWVRTEDPADPWSSFKNHTEDDYCQYAEIAAVRVLSEGVTA